jgi:hypothetical protein
VFELLGLGQRIVPKRTAPTAPRNIIASDIPGG